MSYFDDQMDTWFDNNCQGRIEDCVPDCDSVEEVRDAPGPNDKGICSVCRRPQPDGYHEHPCE